MNMPQIGYDRVTNVNVEVYMSYLATYGVGPMTLALLIFQ